MNNREAMRALADGKRVQRDGWPDGEWIEIAADGALRSENNNLAGTYWIHDYTWHIVPETFDFMEAMRRVRDGKRVRRMAWVNEWLSPPVNDLSALRLAVDDIFATDWIEVGDE